MSKKQVQQQFGASAAAYAASPVHARGASLARLVALTQPQPQWRVLDVATGAGHTAFAFAPRVAQVTAVDITPQMLQVARELAAEKRIENVSLATADAEDLPFADNSFQLVTCRIAPHHFDDVARFLREAARVLAVDGVLAVVDNVVPGSRLRGKKAKLQRQAGDYVNALEKLRDPGHGRCLSLIQWQDKFRIASLTLTHQELNKKTIDFDAWVGRMRVPPKDKIRLRAMLAQAPAEVADFLTPNFVGDRITFQLSEAILIGKRKGAA